MSASLVWQLANPSKVNSLGEKAGLRDVLYAIYSDKYMGGDLVDKMHFKQHDIEWLKYLRYDHPEVMEIVDLIIENGEIYVWLEY